MATEMKTIKIPEQELDRVKEARRLVAMQGLNRLDDKSKNAIQKDVADFDKLTLGIIIGIGSILLIQALSN